MQSTETVTASAIARVLHESQRQMIARALRALGQDRCVELLADALTIESNGGMWLKDGSRRRTLGGVFLQLCRERSTPEERRKIFR
jgi:phosphorylated adapter RNA export protein